MKQLIVAMLISAVIGGAAGWVFRGAASDRGVIRQQAKDADEVLKHDLDRKATTKEVEKIIVRIKKINDPIGCYNNPIPDSAAKLMRDSDSTSQSGFDP